MRSGHGQAPADSSAPLGVARIAREDNLNTAARQVPAEQPGSWARFDDARWRRRMQQADVADELFLPLENGNWDDARFRLVRGERAAARTRITGVRYLAADPKQENLEPERAVQNDFHRLLTSLIKLRAEPDCSGLCLSGETFRTSPRRDVQRLRFGLRRAALPEDGDDQAKATERGDARRCYKSIRRSIRRAGFVVEAPTTRFDPQTGLAGLRDWTDQLRLRKRQRWWPWLLLLPLLLLIPRCDPQATFFGAPIETRNFVLLVDRSGSMQSHFPTLQAEARRVLAQLVEHGSCAANVIAYDSHAESCLGGILPVDQDTAARMQTFLDALASGGGTNLQSGIEMAAQEIAEDGRPTTLIVLTDAQDGSIAGMVGNRDQVLAQFKDVEIHTYGLTPRLYAPAATGSADNRGAATQTTPQGQHEQQLGDFSEMLGGRFGARQAAPHSDQTP